MAPYVYDFAVSRRASRRLIFTSGQSVYIISPTFGLQRKAGEQFTKDRRFKLASGISRADFVFVALSEAKLALVLLPDDYSQYRANLDRLREHALWQGEARLHGFGSGSEVQLLVQQFEQEVLRQTADPLASR